MLIFMWISFLSELRMQKTKAMLFNTVAAFIKLLFISFAFVLTTGFGKKPVATKSLSSFSFCLTYSLSHLSYLCGALDVCFVSVLLPFFSRLFRSLNFAEKNGYLSRFRCGFFFLLFVWNYWLHNGPVKIKVNCTPRKEYDEKIQHFFKKSVLHDFNTERWTLWSMSHRHDIGTASACQLLWARWCFAAYKVYDNSSLYRGNKHSSAAFIKSARMCK